MHFKKTLNTPKKNTGYTLKNKSGGTHFFNHLYIITLLPYHPQKQIISQAIVVYSPYLISQGILKVCYKAILQVYRGSTESFP